MKQISLILLCLLALATGCSLQDSDLPISNSGKPSLQGSAGQTLRESITLGKTANETFDLYQSLPPGHKALVWKDKMEHSKQFFTDPDKIAYLQSMKQSINASMIVTPVPDETIALKDALLHFDAVDVDKIFFYLHDYDDTPDPRRPNISGGSTPDCTCNWGISCGLGSCDYRGCNQTLSGCGILWLSPCKGKCDNTPI